MITGSFPPRDIEAGATTLMKRPGCTMSAIRALVMSSNAYSLLKRRLQDYYSEGTEAKADQKIAAESKPPRRMLHRVCL